MKCQSYLLLLICIGSGSCGVFGEREEVQTASNKFEDLERERLLSKTKLLNVLNEIEKEELLSKTKLLDVLREEYDRLDTIKAERQKQEGLLEMGETNLKDITQRVENMMTKFNKLELKSNQLQEEYTKLEKNKDSVSNEIEVEVSKLEETTQKVEKMTKGEKELLVKIRDENAEIVKLTNKKNTVIHKHGAEVLKLEEVSLKVKNMMEDNAVVRSFSKSKKYDG